MGFATSSLQLMLNAFPSSVTVSLHSADPGATGANELAGGSYARQAGSVSAVSGTTRTLSVGTEHNVPSGATVAYVGVWDGATWRGGWPVTPETYAAAGTYQVDDSPLSIVDAS